MKKVYLIGMILSIVTLTACEMPSGIRTGEIQTNSGAKVGKIHTGTRVNTPAGSTTIKDNKDVNKKKEGISNGNKFIGFVSTGCPHCQEAVPSMEKFATNTNGNIEINVVDKKPFPGVSVLKQEYNHPKGYKDYTNEECGYIPSYVIINKDGKVIEKKCGGTLGYDELKEKLLLSKKENKETNLKTNPNKKMTDNNGVRKGDKIAVDYIGKFTDGKIFDTSIESEAKKAKLYNSARTYKPLDFVVGEGHMIPCFDKGVEGMKIGETKEIKCEPKDAYGECDKSKVIKVEKAKLASFEKNGYKLEKGVELPTQYGPLKITDIKDDIVYLDTNSPMCGKNLIFTVTLKTIIK